MTDSPDFALVTGASSGLGADMARILAGRDVPLILTARRTEPLEVLAEELRDRYPVKVRVLPLDLGESGAGDTLADAVQDEGLSVGFLVNNAAFGQFGPYPELARREEAAMIRLNVEALTVLTRRLLPGMLERGRGRILNVASIAAFVPGPLMTVYYATKAYVLSYSEALDHELRGSGVTVTCLCPGPTRTGFQARAEMELPSLPMGVVMDSMPVARAGIEAAFKGRRLVIPGFFNKLATLAPRFLPRALLPKLVESIQAGRNPGKQA